MSSSVVSVVTCVEGFEGSQGPCPDGFVQHVEDYVLLKAVDATAGGWLFGFDNDVAFGVFGWTFGVTLGLWLLSFGVGSVVKAVKRF